MALTVGSVFAGVGGFDVGFERAGFRVLWQIERDADCRAVLANHFTAARLLDVNAYAYGRARNRRRHGLTLPSVDVIVAGFPCQDVSVAGKRAGLAGSRTGLFWALMRIVAHVKPSAVVFENVPGLLTSNRGRDFHAVLSALAERGFRRSYRLLDSQYFGVAQRRVRLFLVGCARAQRGDPRAVLFEPAGRNGHSAPRRATRSHVAPTLRGRASRGGINEPGRGGEDDLNLIPCHTLSGEGHAPSLAFTISSTHRGVGQGHNTTDIAGPLGGGNDGIGRRSEDDPNLVYAITENMRNRSQGPANYVLEDERERALVWSMFKRHDDDTDTLIAAPITASAGHHGHSSPRGDGRDNLIAATLNSGGHDGGFRTEPGEHLSVVSAASVRRLTPLECERLQGFPDGWTCRCGNGHLGTRFCTCPDTPRYKQLGNAVTVPVAEWIARRLRTELTSCPAR